MSAFSRIDFSRTLTLSGSNTVITDNPTFVKLAEEMQTPQVLRVATPLARERDVVLTPGEARALALFIATSPWRQDMEDTLQGMACDDTGNLLTGWMSAHRFVQFVSAAAKEGYLAEIVKRIEETMRNWLAQNIDEVYFDWYEKVPESQTA